MPFKGLPPAVPYLSPWTIWCWVRGWRSERYETCGARCCCPAEVSLQLSTRQWTEGKCAKTWGPRLVLVLSSHCNRKPHRSKSGPLQLGVQDANLWHCWIGEKQKSAFSRNTQRHFWLESQVYLLLITTNKWDKMKSSRSKGAEWPLSDRHWSAQKERVYLSQWKTPDTVTFIIKPTLFTLLCQWSYRMSFNMSSTST